MGEESNRDVLRERGASGGEGVEGEDVVDDGAGGGVVVEALRRGGRSWDSERGLVDMVRCCSKGESFRRN